MNFIFQLLNKGMPVPKQSHQTFDEQVVEKEPILFVTVWPTQVDRKQSDCEKFSIPETKISLEVMLTSVDRIPAAAFQTL